MCTPTRQWATFIIPGCVVGFCLLYDQKAEYVEQLKCSLLIIKTYYQVSGI